MRGLPARGRSRPKKLVRHRQQHPVRLATLNVGTLTGRSGDSLERLQVKELGDGYKLIYHSTSNRNGVGIILNESFRNSVTAVDRLSDHLMAVKVDTGEVELRVVSACVTGSKGAIFRVRGSIYTSPPYSKCRGNVVVYFQRYTLDRGEHSGKDGSRTRQPEDRGAYLAAKREAKKAVSKAKSDRNKAVYDMLDTREGERAVYRLVRARHRSTLNVEHTKIVKGADGAVLRRSCQTLERWREYYNHLCNEEFCHLPIPTLPSVEGPVLPITAVEVSAALAKMKSNKAVGPDDIPADVWKLLGDRGSVWLATLFNKIVAEGRTPDVWQSYVTVWKGKGDIADCTSYRPIRLLCHTMKVLERVLEARLKKIVSVSLNQCGFVKDCSTIDAIHAARIFVEKHREKNRGAHLAFLDLEKAFDRVPHELL
ncbi:hypothetical protein RB195_020283 [Necator americanus]|uniref:Reverse transcriptase domain-containing protein n=1 Tax=Necator americanus TaxID=51031 RepID=A0ABR1CJX5_NECAM